MKQINPLTRLDYPDVDVIRVEDTYYMISTTMYFMPGCEILRSYDLVHWEHAVYVYDRLDSTPFQCLQGGNIYGQGMWAASLRYHNGKFHVVFVANDTGKTYLYTADRIEGPWEKRTIEGFYHDCSLLFDDDGRVYVVYGNRNIRLTELKPDLSGPLPGGLDRIVVRDEEGEFLGYEGAHFYKINGKYYLFFIHWPPNPGRRTEACFVADSLEGEFVGGDILNDDMGYCNQGVAQGAIVDTPEGKWYAVLFQDRGAVGRIPVLIPLTWENDYPVLGVNGKIPAEFEVSSTRPDHVYEPLVQSDDFKWEAGLSAEEEARKYGSFGFKSCWQFNHEPNLSLVHCDEDQGVLWLTSGALCENVLQARNTLTQRTLDPGCIGEVTVDVSKLKDGDYAGICALQSCYGFVGITKRDGQCYAVMHARQPENPHVWSSKTESGQECEAVPVEGEQFRLRVVLDFDHKKDEAEFFYEQNGEWKKIGPTHKMHYTLDHFTGYRFGLFLYSTKETGGQAGFQKFEYKEK